MIRINSGYCEFFDDSDPDYKFGKAVDAPTGDSVAGTSWDAAWFNQILGFFTAAIVDALGPNASISGTPDKAGASEVLDAIKIISARITDQNVTPALILQRLKTVDGVTSGLDAELLAGRPAHYYLSAGAGFYVKPISGPETVIPLEEIELIFEEEKQYCVFVQAAGNHPEYISYNAEIKSDGLYIRPVRLLNGELTPGTGIKKWGGNKWGEGRIFVPGQKWGMGKWGIGKWNVVRYVGGDTWGGDALVYINIIIKEL